VKVIPARMLQTRTRGQRWESLKGHFRLDQTTSCLRVSRIDLIKFLCAQPKNIRLLKLDIEGAEVPILEALLSTRAIKRIDKLFVETHDNKIPELSLRMKILRKQISQKKLTSINLDWR
jgi:hypothetical protein